MELQFERIEYGTSSQPGGLTRSSAGDYFTFESDRNGLLTNWSTDLSAPECLDLLRGAFPDIQATPKEDASVLGLLANGLSRSVSSSDFEIDGIDRIFGGDHSIDPTSMIVDMPTSDAIETIGSQRHSLISARLGFIGLEMIWHRPYARFVDSDLERAEVGIYTRDFRNIPGIGVFARSTGNATFFDAVPVTAEIREKGNAKHVRI